MAKSLRSKSKLRAKSVKRKGEFAEFVDQRNKRLNLKALEKLKEQKDAAIAKKQEMIANGEMEEKSEEPAEQEKKEEKKVSTSGWRGSHSQQFKKRKHKKNRTMRF